MVTDSCRVGQRRLRTFEERIGIALPDELRRFLGHVHGGGAGPGYGLAVDREVEATCRRARPFPFDTGMATSIIARRLSGSERWASVPSPTATTKTTTGRQAPVSCLSLITVAASWTSWSSAASSAA